MLRRIAEELFWAARYLERAQWRARLVDVNYNLLLEGPPRDSEPWEALLAITSEVEAFGTHHSHADERSVVNFFTLARENPSSIRRCIEEARTNVASMRHQVPSEVWLEINRLYLDAMSWPADAHELASIPSFFTALRERFYMIGGVIQATMPRGLAFDFVEAGTMLECADNVARLLDVKYHYLLPHAEDVGGDADGRQWAALLRSASSLEAFRQIYGNAMKADRVVEILLFNGDVPRSARFCADRIALVLGRIASDHPEPKTHQVDENRLSSLLAQQSAKTVIREGLHEFLMDFQDECAALATRIATAYMTID
jgi:uncharacterized alpha-E superfamily protein